MDSIHPIQSVRRYRSNPIEVCIFGLVGLVLINSIYHLFYDHSAFTANALTAMKSNAFSDGRQLASTSQNLSSIQIQCDENPPQETSSSKLRFKGPICGMNSERSGSSLIKTTFINSSNQFAATVFTDLRAGEFSTDYIPLVAGDNLIHFEFAYKDGTPVSQDMHLNRK